MPHIPDHLTHDPELVAAYAAGDATGPALAEATDLVAACTECAELHRDLRAIATALPELPVPVRTRDFRLTPTQAASLQPSGWRGVLAAFASPRFRLAAPLGTGLAAVGLAGLLLATPGGLIPAASSTSGSGAAGTIEGGAPGDIPQPEDAALSNASEVPAAETAGPSDAQPAPSAAASEAAASAAASGNPAFVVPDLAPAAGSMAVTSGGSRNGTTAAGVAPTDDGAGQLQVKTTDGAYATAPEAAPIAPATDNTPLAVIAAGLLIAGILLVALRVSARAVA